MVKSIAVLVVASLMLVSALSQAYAAWRWHAPMADPRVNGTPTHLVAAGDDNPAGG